MTDLGAGELGRRPGVSTRFAQQADRTPEYPCLVWDGGSYTYRQLDEAALSLPARLSDSGLELGDKVAVLSPNSPVCVVAILATQNLGGVLDTDKLS